MKLLQIMALLAPAVASSPVDAAPRCTDLLLPITYTASLSVFPSVAINSNIDAANLAFNMTRRDAAAVAIQPTSSRNVTSTHTISARFCTPATNSTKSSIVHVLTAGIGFDKTYYSFPGIVSYVDAALAAGYSTLSYDRLGTGLSDHPDALQENQANADVEILHQLTLYAKEQAGVKKTVIVGHSYGSFVTATIARLFPDLIDGVVLTGFSSNSSFGQTAFNIWGFRTAAQNQPARFGDLDGKYLTWADEWSNQEFFQADGDFDPVVLERSEGLKQPVGLGVLLTRGPLVRALNTEFVFDGPVMIISGQFDLPECGGNCTGILEQSAQFFVRSQAKGNYEAVIHPNSGHGINLARNATGAYTAIFGFLGARGL